MISRIFLILTFFIPIFAYGETFTISSNNTPLDYEQLVRKVPPALERLGFDVKMLRLPSENGITKANNGEIDAEGLRISGLETKYDNLIRVDVPITKIRMAAFSKTPRSSMTWEDLKDSRIAYIAGWKLFESKAYLAASSYRVETPEQLFLMLNSGRIDYALYTYDDGLKMIKDLGYDLFVVTQPLSENDLYLYVNKRHEKLIPLLKNELKKSQSKS